MSKTTVLPQIECGCKAKLNRCIMMGILIGVMAYLLLIYLSVEGSAWRMPFNKFNMGRGKR